jgi:DNA invertase Pin-like site-specific DNA recombinase
LWLLQLVSVILRNGADSVPFSGVTPTSGYNARPHYVREGNSFTVTKLDRLAQSVGDLLAIVSRLKVKGVSLRVLAMSGTQSLDTDTSTGRLMLSVIGAVGQAEREAMLERQRRDRQAPAGGPSQGPCADRSATGCRDSPAQGGGRQALGSRHQAGDRSPASIGC